MRQFKLINGLGYEFDLMRKDAYFNNPDNLGYERDITTSQTGDFFIASEDKTAAVNPNGEMVFKGYEQYHEFLAFIKYAPLTFCYMPLDTWYYAKVTVSSLKKSEKKIDGRLYCNIDFLRHSPYYSSITVSETEVDVIGEKSYPYSYPFTYYNTSTNMIELNLESDESPVKLTIFGPCVNPHYSLVQNDNVIAEGIINITLTENEKIIIDANPLSLGINKFDLLNNFKSDVYNNSNFATERFLYAPLGYSYITFSHDGGTDMSVIAEVTQYEQSV